MISYYVVFVWCCSVWILVDINMVETCVVRVNFATMLILYVILTTFLYGTASCRWCTQHRIVHTTILH